MTNHLTAPPATTQVERYRRAALGLLVLLAAVGVIAWAGQWAAGREAASVTEAMARDMEVQALALRGAAAHFNYLPYTAAQHPDVIAMLASPQDAAVKGRVNRYLEDVNGHAGSVALYVMDATGTALAASNWRAPPTQSFVGESYANRPYFRDAHTGPQRCVLRRGPDHWRPRAVHRSAGAATRRAAGCGGRQGQPA